MNQTQNARRLRKNMTGAELALWRRLRFEQIEGYKFRRQCPIGAYIVDFVCFDKMLVIEVDGGQHADRRVEDEQRTAWLEKQGYKVLRFWNNQVLFETHAVVEKIRQEMLLLDRPYPSLPPWGEGVTKDGAEPDAKASVFSGDGGALGSLGDGG